MARQDDRQGHVPCASASDTNANSDSSGLEH